MGSDNEPAKTLLPYLQRADELQKHELLVAYYCRLYAMEKGLKIPPKERTKTTNSLLVSLMNQLEKDKKLLKFAPEDNLYVEGFALNVFAKADKQDRAGRADLNTAKTFYAASIFFEVLEQFGELQSDIEQKRKYSIWKAADIRKALKEGRKPEPSPPGGEKDLSLTSTSDNSYNLDSNHNLPSNHHTDSSHTQDPQDKSIQPPSTTTILPPSHSPTNYPARDYHQSPSSTKPENYVHPHSYSPDHQQYQCSPPNPMYQSFSNDSQQHYNQSYTPEQQYGHSLSPENNNQSPQNYPHDNSTLSYTHSSYQSYPSFNDGNRQPNLTHYPSSNQTNPAHYPSSHEQAVQYIPTPSNDGLVQCGNVYPQPVTFHYDVNYQPSPEKIVDAHKAARFAVGALAFDDVPVAVEFLKRSLELLTNPSATQ